MLARSRSLVVPLGVIAAALLVYMENPWFAPAEGSTLRAVATVVFWFLAIALLILMFEDRNSPDAQQVEVEGPAFTRYLFSNTRAGLFWLPDPSLPRLRLDRGRLAQAHRRRLDRRRRRPARLLDDAVEGPRDGPEPPISFEWYRGFLSS